MKQYFSLRRLLSLVLTLVLLTALLPAAPARAISLWEELLLSVVTYDAYGNEVLIPAQPVPEREDHAYWFTLDPSLLGSTLTVRVEYPDPSYIFYFNDYSLNYLWTMDAASLDSQYAQYIGYSVGDINNFRNMFPVFFSTQPMPLEDPVESVVRIPVSHVTEDGQLLDTQYVQGYPGKSVIVSANSGKTTGYTLLGSSTIEVYVDANGRTSPEDVAFVYRANAPVEEPVRNAVIPVYYVHVNGDILDYYELTLEPGTHTVRENSAAVRGLKRVTDDAVKVTVNRDGSADKANVSFYYEDEETFESAPTSKPAVSVTGKPQEENTMSSYGYINGSSVNLREQPSADAKRVGSIKRYGYCLVLGTEKAGGVTWYHVSINDMSGYVHGDYFKHLTVADAEAFVNSAEYQQGLRSNPPAEATSAPAAKAVIPVYYVHINGDILDYYELTLEPGTHAVRENSPAIRGLKRVTDDTVYVTVNQDGSTDAVSISFYYEDAESFDPVPTTGPQEENTMSSYGYINGSSVNLREQPSADAKRVGSIKRYGYCLVLGTEKVGGVTWYHVSINDMTGYVHGDYFKHLTVADAEAFVNSAEYQQGLRSNPPAEATSAPAAKAVIPVYYVHINGDILDYYELTLEPGTHAVRENSAAIHGLKRVSDAAVFVTVYPDGSSNTASVSFYYEDIQQETATPVPAPVQAEVTVLYLLEDGTVLDTQYQYRDAGSHVIYPGSSRVGDYELTGLGYQEIHVDQQGRVSPNPVVFEYRKASASITVHYQDDRGRDVAPVQTRILPDGVHLVKAAPEGLSADYELAPGLHSSVEVTIQHGVASQSDVYFYYQKVTPVPSYVNVTIHYYDTYGKEIASAQTRTLEVGQHRLSPAPTDLPAGYELASEDAITVEVYENGSFSPQEIAFYYRPVQTAQNATVTLLFKDSAGREIAASRTRTLGNGTHILKPEKGDVPEGFEILPGTAAEVEVTVRSGKANQQQVTFYFHQVVTAPQEFSIPVHYYDTMGNPIATTQYAKAVVGKCIIKANPADLPAGYELMMEDTLSVQVFEDGTTEPEEVAFYYRAPAKAATVTVQITDGQSILTQYSVELAGDREHTLKPDARYVPEGYDASNVPAANVRVTRDGVAIPAIVAFQVERLVVETPIPVGSSVYRYATVTSGKVAFRNEPSVDGGNKTVIRRFSKNEVVYVLQELYNEDGEIWAMLNVDGRIGYTDSKYIQVMTQAESDRHAAFVGATPVPTFTPVPTASPTPTASPSPTPSMVPVRSAVIPVYYYHVNGTLLDMYEVTLAPGVHYIGEGSAAIIGLDRVSEPTVQVIVFQDGASDVASIVFQYDDPAPAETATPTVTPSPTPTPYTGYALTTRSTALRTGISSSDMSIIHNMEANELVIVSGQLQAPITGEDWSIVTTMRGQHGYMLSASLRAISQKEAQPYLDMWEQINASPVPTQAVTPSPEPMQMQGYGVAIGDHVPFRQMASEYSRIIDNLKQGTVVYISAQTWVNGTCWHSVTYDGAWGYVRSDLVRMMTLTEEDAYLESLFTPAPTMATTNQPFDENGLSSYGYINASSVNMREEPSTSAKRLGEIKRYGYCLVLGTTNVGGVTWYNVYYNEKIGYVHGDFFEHLTIAEAADFKESEEYQQGVRNNSASSNTDDEGYTGLGGSVSAEDQLVNEWLDPNNGSHVSYAPFVPTYNTPQPLNSPTLEPLPGATEVPTATPTPTFNPLPSVTYPTTGSAGGGSNVIWVVVLGLLLIAAGGVFCLLRYQQKRRRIAMRAAQRRAQAARAQQQRPYARQANPAAPRTGAYPGPAQARRTLGDQPTGQYTPYASGLGAFRGDAVYTRPGDDAGATRQQPLPVEGWAPEKDADFQRTRRTARYKPAEDDPADE